MARHRCPVCTSPLIRIVWGLPGYDLVEAEQRGEIKLGGCCLPVHGPAGWCPTCEVERGFTCPVCGYGRLPEAPWGEWDKPMTEPCPCCGTRFGTDAVSDDPEHYRVLRQSWVDGGCRWTSTQISPPRRWTPQAQLRRVGL